MKLLNFFEYKHLPERLQGISKACHDLAVYMDATLPDSEGLRKLLEAKDCFVRANLITQPPKKR